LQNDNIHSKKAHSKLGNERLLLQKVSEGDWSAYADLFNFYLPKLSQYIFPLVNKSREDTEEVIQEVFLKIWERRETLITIKSFDGYLFRMVKNHAVDLKNRRKSTRNLQIRYLATRDTFHTEPELSLLYSEYHSIGQKAVKQLSPKLQTVFLMSSQEEYSLDEIANKLDLPKETVKKRLFLAKTAIKSYLRSNAKWLAILALSLLFC
jgi:RNA polymerase sigma factor (sigma-70 family)